MPRAARIVIPGIPHHVTQRGNRRQPVFFCDEDYQLYKDLLAEWCARAGVQIWAYCLMSNHVHLVAVPAREESLARGIGEAHRRYTTAINRRERWTGHLWQGRFASFAMDERYALQAVRYVERNPVAAKMEKHAWDYPWSSARAHIKRAGDGFLTMPPLLEAVEDWRAFLRTEAEDDFDECWQTQSAGGWPLGDAKFLGGLERKIGRAMAPRPRGRPKLSGKEE